MRESVESKNIEFRLDKPRPRVALSAMSNIKQYGRVFALCCLFITLSCAGNKNGGGDPDSPPETPQNFEAMAMALDRQVRLSWNTEPNVTYELYHSTETGFALESGMKISSVTTPYDHEELMNDTTYYYRLRAVNDFGVSEPTDEISATPKPPPTTPQGLMAEASGAGQITLSWTAEEGLTYDLYHSTTQGFELANGMKISGVTSPYSHRELTPNTTYYYRLTAVNDSGASAPTPEVSKLTLPAKPQNFMATVSGRDVRLSWEDSQIGVTYTLFFGSAPGIDVGNENPNKIEGIPRLFHDFEDLLNNTRHYYRLTAVNDSGSSAPTTEVSVIIPPAAPENFTAEASDGQVTLRWTQLSSLTYDIFFATSAGIDVSDTSVMKITGIITSPYTHTGLTNTTTYYYRLTANNSGGASEPTDEISATPRVEKKISAGGNYTCAVAGGRALCWGEGGSGQLGTGNNSDALTPQQAGNLTANVMRISAGDSHTCAVVNGRAFCWGKGGDSQLGHNEMDSETASKLTPTQVEGLTTGVTEISAGTRHTCAVAGDRAFCWGKGADGRLGTGNDSNANAPAQVVDDMGTAISEVTKISAGEFHSCAVVGGAAMCWGWGNQGRLGTGNTSDANFPKTAGDLTSGVTQISAGGNHSCAVVNGAAWCWGSGGVGQLGHNDPMGATRDKTAPTPVSGLTTGVTQISAGDEHTCAVVGGAAKCWGEGASGRLGTGNNSDQTTPTQVIGLTSGVTEISAGKEHTCAVVEGRAVCWGESTSGRLGNNNSEDDQNTPVSVSDP